MVRLRSDAQLWIHMSLWISAERAPAGPLVPYSNQRGDEPSYRWLTGKLPTTVEVAEGSRVPVREVKPLTVVVNRRLA